MASQFQFGDYGGEVYMMVKKALRDGIRDFIVVDGMVLVGDPAENALYPHTWIERGGRVVDPTKSQFGPAELVYSPPGEYREEYSPAAYLRHWDEQYGAMDV